MKFKEVEPLKIGDLQAFVSYDAGYVELSQYREVIILNEREWCLALRDWLNRVLDSYPARPDGQMLTVRIHKGNDLIVDADDLLKFV